MTMFYMSPGEQISHTEGITIVRGVETAKMYLAKPECLLTMTMYFSRNVLDENDVMQCKLQEP